MVRGTAAEKVSGEEQMVVFRLAGEHYGVDVNYPALTDGASWFKDPACRRSDTPAVEAGSPQA